MADVPHLPAPTRWSIRQHRGRRHGAGPHRVSSTAGPLVVRLTHTRADESSHAAVGYGLAVAAVAAIAIAPWLLVIVAAIAFPLLVREPGATLQDEIDLAADRDVIRVVHRRREHRLATRDIASLDARDGRLDAILHDGTRWPIAVVAPDAAEAAADAITRHLGLAQLPDGGAPAQIEAPPAPRAPVTNVVARELERAAAEVDRRAAIECTRCGKALDLRDADRQRLTLDCAACGATVDVSRHAETLRGLPPRGA